MPVKTRRDNGMSADASAPETLDSLDIVSILDLLPHRYPFVMIDRVVSIERGLGATALKNVTINEPYFQGHFPKRPVMPGVLMIEAMAQTAAIVVVDALGGTTAEKLVYFMSVENARFRRPVGPGDQLKVQVTKLRSRGEVWKFQGVCRVDGATVAEAVFTAMITD